MRYNNSFITLILTPSHVLSRNSFFLSSLSIYERGEIGTNIYIEEVKNCRHGAVCFEWCFTRTFPRNQDATLKLKSELIFIKF